MPGASNAVTWVEFVTQVQLWPGLSLKEVEVGKTYRRFLSDTALVVGSGHLQVDPVPAVVLDGVTYPMTSVLRYR